MTENTYAKELYHWRKEHGICTRCGKAEATHGNLCVVCAVEGAEYQRKKYYSLSPEEKEELLKKQRAQKKALGDYRKEHGLCRRCGKPAYKGMSMCYEHWLNNKRRYRENAARKKQEALKSKAGDTCE